MKEKHCSRCLLVLPIEQFGTRNGGRWFKSWCKPCEAEVGAQYRMENPPDPDAFWRQALKRKFGITEDDYDDMLEKQDGRCGICGTSNPGSSRKKFSVDHCHRTRKIRGLLCNKCNMALGNLGDRLETVEKAVAYLKAAQ